MKDSQRDQWVEDNLPDDMIFDPTAVKILMRLAYEEGRKRELRVTEERRREDLHGPAFI